MGVVKVVWEDAGQVEFGEEAFDGLADQVGVDGQPWGLATTSPSMCRAVGGHAVFELAAPVPPHLCDGMEVEIDGRGLEVAFDEPVSIARSREICDSMKHGSRFITTRRIDENTVRAFYEEGMGPQ